MKKVEELQELHGTLQDIAAEKAVDYLFQALRLEGQIKMLEHDIYVEKILELCRTGK
jgi:hypothetical protein